jgi:hypothetical protein
VIESTPVGDASGGMARFLMSNAPCQENGQNGMSLIPITTTLEGSQINKQRQLYFL